MTTELSLKERVEKSLDAIRPALQLDGGDVELVDVEDGVVKVKLQGACHGCPMAAMTLQMGIERTLKRDVPEIKGVESVSDLEEESPQGHNCC
jgi:Fe-S cluster biogenesis protein NfuA